MHALYSQLTILLRIRSCHQEHDEKESKSLFKQQESSQYICS